MHANYASNLVLEGLCGGKGGLGSIPCVEHAVPSSPNEQRGGDYRSGTRAGAESMGRSEEKIWGSISKLIDNLCCPPKLITRARLLHNIRSGPWTGTGSVEAALIAFIIWPKPLLCGPEKQLSMAEIKMKTPSQARRNI